MPNLSQTEKVQGIYSQTGQNHGNETEALTLIQEKRIMEKVADILTEEKLITPLEKLNLKEKINKYRGTL